MVPGHKGSEKEAKLGEPVGGHELSLLGVTAWSSGPGLGSYLALVSDAATTAV